MQFSLRSLLLLPVVLVCAAAALSTKPNSVAFVEFSVIAFALPAVLTATIVYGHGYRRAFCIGAMFPAGAMCVWCVLNPSLFTAQNWANVDPVWLQGLFAADWLAAVLCGCLCVGVRWLFQRPDAGIDAADPHGWRQAVFILVLVFLVLSGPIIGRIGLSLGWWQPDPSPVSPFTRDLSPVVP